MASEKTSAGGKGLMGFLIAVVLLLWFGAWMTIPLKAGCKTGASTVERTHQACERVRILGVPRKNRSSAAVWYVALGTVSAAEGDFQDAEEKFDIAYERATEHGGSEIILSSGYKTQSALVRALDRAYHPHVVPRARQLLWDKLQQRDPDLVIALQDHIETGEFELAIDWCATNERYCEGAD